MNIIITLTVLSLLFIIYYSFKGFWKDIFKNIIGYLIGVLFLLGLFSGIIDLI